MTITYKKCLSDPSYARDDSGFIYLGLEPDSANNRSDSETGALKLGFCSGARVVAQRAQAKGFPNPTTSKQTKAAVASFPRPQGSSHAIHGSQAWLTKRGPSLGPTHAEKQSVAPVQKHFSS